MDVHAFLRTRPCLEGVEGYLEGLRIQIAHPELLHGLAPQYAVIDGDVLRPIEDYRQRLLAGKEVPAPTKLEQDWVYKQKRPPVRKRAKMEVDDDPMLIEHEERPRRVLDLNSRKKT